MLANTAQCESVAGRDIDLGVIYNGLVVTPSNQKVSPIFLQRHTERGEEERTERWREEREETEREGEEERGKDKRSYKRSWDEREDR